MTDTSWDEKVAHYNDCVARWNEALDRGDEAAAAAIVRYFKRGTPAEQKARRAYESSPARREADNARHRASEARRAYESSPARREADNARHRARYTRRKGA